jgi:uncharacterized protein YfdQ (DUF2303 family)
MAYEEDQFSGEHRDVSAAVAAGMSIGRVLEIAHGISGVMLPAGAKLERFDMHELAEKHADNPSRKKGERSLATAQSFIAYVNAHKQASTAIYASKDRTRFDAVFNDHEPEPREGNTAGATLQEREPSDEEKAALPEGATIKAVHEVTLDLDVSAGLPGWGDFKAAYACPLSVEWKRWMAKSQHEKERKEGMAQADFMQFLEDNLQDVVRPEGALLLTAAHNFEAKKDVSFKSATRLQDGSIAFLYDEKVNEVSQPGKIALPSEFTICIPVFEGGAKYEVDARLRYRVNGGGLVLWYELVKTHKILEHAFNTVLQEVSEGTKDVPIYSV